MRFLKVGDLHIRGTNPRNRTDNYKEALKAKLLEINALAVKHDVEAILCMGDIFDKPEVSTGVLLEFADVFAESEKPWYTTPGNHDLYSYNLATYWRTSLALLERLVPNFYVIQNPAHAEYFIGDEVDVAVSFTPFTAEIDRDGYGYSPDTRDELTVPREAFRIHVAHGMLLDHTPPFDRFTLVQEVETTADLVLTGHDHTGYGVFRRADGKVFVNCGAVPRLSASIAEIERPIQVALIEVLPDKKCDIQLLPLESAAPGVEVLDRSRIEAEQKRQYAMESFAFKLNESLDGESALVDVDSIVKSVAEAEGIASDVVKLALDKINDAKLKVTT